MIAVIADGGPTTGLGHLARSSAVTAALRARGLEVVTFAYGAHAPRTLDGVVWAPYAGPPPGVVVLDTYTMPAGELAPRVVFYDGEGEIPPSAELVIVSGPEREGTLGGLRHAPLRAPFWGLPDRRVRARIERVLVTTGGGGDRGVELAATAKEALPDASVALVRGPLADFEPSPGVELVNAPPSLLSELLAADVVVSAAGQTALEAVATGAATIALPLVPNQRANAAALAAAGAALVTEPEQLRAALSGLDARTRAELARRGQAAVDGFGALRIAFQIAALA